MSESYEGYIVCPVCGYRDPDSFMVWDDIEECACKRCGAIMSVEVERITYYKATVLDRSKQEG